MATGIKDKVAILGMGCSRFGERFDVGTHELLAEAFDEALVDAGVERKQIEAAWFGSCLDGIGHGVPCQVDGGLKCFGHPIGASGLRMVYEVYNQLLGRAGERQLASPSLGLTHNLGGVPYQGIAAISVLGLH